MTGRDRIVLMVVIIIAVLGGGYLMVVSPKSKEASKLASQVTEARSQLSSAEGQLSQARSAQAQYASAYASVVSLGKAVPASQEVPSLMIELSQATNTKHVEFTSITATGAGTGSAGTSASATSAASAGFSQMPFTLVFEGGFFELERLFQQLNGFTVHPTSGELQVSGRLLTIQSVKLAPASSSAPAAGAALRLSPRLTGTITASAYVLPAGQSLTAGATASSPAGSSSTVSASGSGSPTTPAVVKVTP